ncbi:MAG: FadR family transcriptional regulator [Mesorhizobium sp.]|nr:MAG: FadR family transcriptional regulator [Mesorhizobium sp.]
MNGLAGSGIIPNLAGGILMTKRKPLSTVVAESLSEKIRSGRLLPGAQLPTEAELCAEYDVSRTVVREAVARLRSEGMVVPQQGRGMFVSETPAPRSFSIPDEALRTLPETIALLELRLSVEVESAGLCAERRSDAEAGAIRAVMEQVDAQQADPAVVQIHYDYDFHLAIAKAARNEFIHGFLAYLRPMIVPRFQLGYVVEPELKDSYYARIHNEHKAIVDAIERQDGRAARQAMRKHLHNSLGRVRALARASGVEATDAEQKAAAASLFTEMNKPMPTAG